MKMNRLGLFLMLMAVCCAGLRSAAFCADASGVEHMEWTVDGVKREALVHLPATAKMVEAPLVFAFHGHGGSMKYAATKFNYHKYMPEAICVYMQGLPCAGITDPKGTLPGWQKGSGDLQDRDLKFFDAVLAKLKADYKVDAKRIYCAGHSNGGAFTYLLWSTRGDVFAAVAPAAAGLVRGFKDLKPLPAMHIAGEKDEIVPYTFQSKMMDAVKKLNGCDSEGKEWAKSGDLTCTQYASKTGTPFVAAIYPGPHKFPEEAPALVAKFFKEHAKQ